MYWRFHALSPFALDETDEPVLLEDIKIKQHSYEQDTNPKEHVTIPKENSYNPTPHFARESCQNRIEDLGKGLEKAGWASYLSKLLQSNN
jgi:hypothetical protein